MNRNLMMLLASCVLASSISVFAQDVPDRNPIHNETRGSEP